MIGVGYIGIEAFDIIIYIGKTLTKLNYPVLIIDLSDTEALARSIYHGMDLESEDNIIHYRNLNYIRRIPTKEELDEFSNGVLLVSYGFNYIESPQLNLDFLYIVVDPFPNSSCKVRKALSKVWADNIKVNILVRNIITLDDFDRVKSGILLRQSNASIRYLYYDIKDYENSLNCQLSQAVRFKKVSLRMKGFIISNLTDILPSVKLSIIRKAVCIARKGDRCR